MHARPVSVLCFLTAVFTLLLATGCSFLPEAKSDPTRFYVLSASTVGSGETAATSGAPAIHLKQVELANYLRARALVVRRGNNEIEFREFARWGESLELGIERVLREELLGRGAASAVVAPGIRREQTNYDYTLSVRVLACEGGARGTVDFRAVWDITPTSTNASPKPAAHGDYRPTDLRWDGKSEASLAAQLSQAVSGLAGEIAAALKK